MKVDDEVGDLIDLYLVQFYNQGSTSYDTYEGLFTKSIGYFKKTSVKEILDRGIPKSKLVVGKPAKQRDVVNTGYVDPATLGQWAVKAKAQLGWSTGFMFWQYASDRNGALLNSVIKGL